LYFKGYINNLEGGQQIEKKYPFSDVRGWRYNISTGGDIPLIAGREAYRIGAMNDRNREKNRKRDWIIC